MSQKVHSKKHMYNGDLRCIFIGDRFWANVPKKDCTNAMRELRRTLALDPWYAERRGY